MGISRNLFQNYCYGPVDLVGLSKGSNTMCLTLKGPAGVLSEAVYSGCIYWRLGEGEVGMHLSLVQRVSADELLKRPDSMTISELHKNADDVHALLREWEAAGLSFFLHLGTEADTEYLVVAKYLHYRELS